MMSVISKEVGDAVMLTYAEFVLSICSNYGDGISFPHEKHEDKLTLRLITT